MPLVTAAAMMVHSSLARPACRKAQSLLGCTSPTYIWGCRSQLTSCSQSQHRLLSGRARSSATWALSFLACCMLICQKVHPIAPGTVGHGPCACQHRLQCKQATKRFVSWSTAGSVCWQPQGKRSPWSAMVRDPNQVLTRAPRFVELQGRWHCTQKLMPRAMMPLTALQQPDHRGMTNARTKTVALASLMPAGKVCQKKSDGKTVTVLPGAETEAMEEAHRESSCVLCTVITSSSPGPFTLGPQSTARTPVNWQQAHIAAHVVV